MEKWECGCQVCFVCSARAQVSVGSGVSGRVGMWLLSVQCQDTHEHWDQV